MQIIWLNINMSKRLKFFLSHLLISAFIASLIVILIFFIWYPSPLTKAVGVTQIFLMLVVIDVLIGPILGLLVYKEGKKSLKFDLTVIILIQLSALCYGVYSIAEGRPAWLVYTVDRFELVRNNEIIADHIQNAQKQYQQPSWLKPRFVAIEFAKDIRQRNDDMFTEVLGGVSIAQKPERYVELSTVKNQIQQRAQRLDVLDNFNNQQQVAKILSKYPQANAWLPLKANAVDMVVLINKEKAQVVKIVDLRPWQ